MLAAIRSTRLDRWFELGCIGFHLVNMSLPSRVARRMYETPSWSITRLDASPSSLRLLIRLAGAGILSVLSLAICQPGAISLGARLWLGNLRDISAPGVGDKAHLFNASLIGHPHDIDDALIDHLLIAVYVHGWLRMMRRHFIQFIL